MSDEISPEDLADFEEFQKSEAESEPTEQETPNVEAEAPSEQETQPEPESNPEPTQEFTFKIKGEEKSFTQDQVRNALSREDTFQRKYDKVSSSEEYKFGVLMAAAQSGDKGAQKALLSKMVEFTGAQDGDQMLSQMEDVKDDFDQEKHLDTKQKTEAFDDAFEDVKSDVDYSETLGKIETDLKARMPAKVFDTYWNRPAERRVMYDLQKSGRTDELFTAFDDQLGQLPLIERAKIKTDPDLYGALFIEVVQSQNAKQGSAKTESPVTEMDSVSSGNRSRSASTETEPDWDSLAPGSPEFKEAEAKMLRKAGLSHMI